MAIVKDEEQQQGQGTSQALGQGMAGQPQQPQEQEQPQQGSSAPATIGASQPSQPSQSSMPMPKQPKAGTGTFANLRSYLQAAQGGGQQKVAQAATQQVQKLGAGAQKGTQQAQQAFGRQMEAGSLKGMETAAQEAKSIVGTARGVTYQAQPAAQPQVTTQAEGQAPATPQPAAPAPAQPQQYFTPEQTQRFSEIINAQYQGPASLQQAGLYEQAAQKARTAQEAAQKTQTALGREQLLKDVFGRTRDYGRGVSKLDALLLNTSQQGVKQLQEQAQPAAQAQEALQSAQNISANEAAQRQAAIEGIRSGARQEFTGARTAEEQATEKRIDDLVKTPAKDESGNPIQKLDAEGKPAVDAEGKPVYMTEWERLPEYFRNAVRTSPETNKQIQQSGIENLEKSSGLTTKRFDELSGQIPQIQKKIAQLQRDIPEGARITGSASQRKQSNMRNQINKLSESLKTLQGEFASYKDFGTQLQGLRNMNMSQLSLSPDEAAILGISSGEGLYNIRPEDIATTQAERSRLITKNELSKQLALQQLAGTDLSKQLQKDVLYSDLEKAGTQDLTRSLNTEAFRNLVNESQQRFKEAAEGTTLTGTGSKKVSRGNVWGKKTNTYYAEQAGNVAAMLRQAGYDIGAETPEGARSLLTDRDLLNRYLGATSTSRDTDATFGGSALEGTAAGAGTGASIGAMTGTGPVGAGIGAVAGAGIGGRIGANTLDQIQYYTDLAKEMEEKLGIKGLGAAGQAVQDVRSGAGGIVSGIGNIAGSNVVGDIFRGVGGAIGGINTGEMKKVGESTAKQYAIKDLQKKYEAWLKGQGFENRANIVDTEATKARTAALQNLLRRQG
jgi:hypothetical protein